MTAQALIVGFGGLVLGILLTALFVRRSSKTPPKINSTNEVELAALAQALKEANLAVESAQKTKSAFLAKMSHELRTPLNAIIGYSEMLIEESCEATPSTSLSDLQKIHGAGKDLLHLINDILDIAEIESGEMKAHLEKFELSKVIRDVTSSVQPLVEKNKNRLEVEILASVGEVQSDPTKLRRILSNLIGNACKFTERGSIKLSVDIADNTGSKYLKFTISDNGRGIAPEMIGSLFKAFTQADQSPIRQGVGTALGLTITHHFCRMLGGDITVKSTLLEGSTFIVTLPFDPPNF